MPININFLANVRDLVRGTTDVEEAFEDVASSLDELAKEGTKAGDKLGDSLGDDIKKGAKDAETAVEKLERGFKDMADTAKKESKAAGRDLDRNIKDGTDGAREGLKDFKDESASTARESAASFDGSADSIVGSFQEIAANAFAGFGPLGAAAGLAAAIGIGVGFTQMQADADATKERVTEAFEDMLESGKAYASEQFINDSLKDIVTDSGKLSDAQKDAASLGLDLSLVLRAQAGDASALNSVITASADKYAAVRDRQRELSETGAPIPGELQGQATAAESLASKYAGLANDMTTAAGQAAIYRDAQVGAASSTDIAKAAVDNFNSAVSQIQSSKSLNIDVDTSAAEAKLAQLARNRTVTINVDGNITRIGNQVW
jgi:hypothetical protein